MTLVGYYPLDMDHTNNPTAASGPGGRWGSVVFGWRALRPPRVVLRVCFIGCVSCNKFSLTSGKKNTFAKKKSKAEGKKKKCFRNALSGRQKKRMSA